jgi:cell division septum initiation protein DivIVA
VESDPQVDLDGVLLPALAVATMVAAGAWFAWRTRTNHSLLMPQADQKGATDMRRRTTRHNDESESEFELDAPRLAGRMEPYLAQSQSHDGQDIEHSEHLAGDGERSDDVDSNAVQATEPAATPSADAEPSQPSLTATVGPHVAAVLQAAESAAQEIVSDAQSEAERLLSQTAQAERLLDETEAYAASVRSNADQDVANLRQRAEEELSALRADAELEALSLREAGEDERDRLVRQGLDRQREIRDATHALEEQLGATLATVRGIANELDELLAASDAGLEQKQEAGHPR